MVEWYVLQVMTGKELEIKDYCNSHGIKALVPRRLIRERYRKKWVDVEKVLMPGYVLINTDIEQESWRNYYTLAGLTSVIRFLKGAGNKPQPVAESEMGFIFAVADNNDLIGISDVVLEGDNIRVTHGALKGYEGRIQSVNLRKYRAKVLISVVGKEKIVELAINVVKKI